MTTPAARNIIKNIVGTSEKLLTTKEIYELSLKKFPNATLPKESKPSGFRAPTLRKLSSGIERQEPPSPPRAEHPIQSMQQLKRKILPDLVARNELVKVHTKRPAHSNQQHASQSSGTPGKSLSKPTESNAKLVDAWVWRFPNPAQPLSKKELAAQPALKIPESPDSPEPQFLRPNSVKPKPKTHAQMYPAPAYVNLNSRRRRARAEKVARRRAWARELDAAMQAGRKEAEKAKEVVKS